MIRTRFFGAKLLKGTYSVYRKTEVSISCVTLLKNSKPGLLQGFRVMWYKSYQEKNN